MATTSILLRSLGSNTATLAAATAAAATPRHTVAAASGILVRFLSDSSSSSSSSSSEVVDVSKLKRSKVPPAPSFRDPDDEAKESPVQRFLNKLQKQDPFAIAGTLAQLPDPVLPENPAEIAFLAPAQARAGYLHYLPNGERRVVLITQQPYSPAQSSKYHERHWHIQFDYENELSTGWENELMGWRSGGDPMASNMPENMVFRNAQEAVYFCQKSDWDYVVNPPIRRKIRSDGAQYQDNFLPQRIAHRVQTQGKRCDQWKRSESGASHYIRPLKYHGEGPVQQHGPNAQQPLAPNVEACYKIR